MKNIKELERIVRGFTAGILDGRSCKNMCFAVCYPLQSYLNICGYDVELKECEIMQGGDTYQHYYLLMDNRTVIDPTAGQFTDPAGFAMPDIYIGELPEWYTETIKQTA